MADTIREQIFANFKAKLETILVDNGYNFDLGNEVFRSFLPPIDFSIMPSIGFVPLLQERVLFHGNHSSYDCQIQIQAIHANDSIRPAQLAELLYADIVEAVLGNIWTLDFDSGGPFQATVGATITGATSGATGYVAGVSLSSGAWDDEDAAGTLTLRRVEGDFIDDELIDIGSNNDVATVNGTLSGDNALTTTTGGLAEEINELAAQPEFPDQNQASTGMQVVFGVKYKRVTGNPYSQTN